MHWWTRLRADLARPETPAGRDEGVLLTASAVAIIALAQASDPGSASDVLVLCVALAAFVLRGLWSAMPSEVFAALAIAPVAFVVADEGELEPTLFLSVLVMLYASWHLGSLARAGLIFVAMATTPWVVSALSDSGIAATPWTVASVFTFAMGRALRRQQALIRELEDARSALAEQAVAEERRRIARELHDLTGHTLAAMMLHVTGARHVLRRDVDEADRALADAENVGRSSLDQIRATVAALRTYEHGTDPALPASADLSALVDEYRRAGIAIETGFTSPTTDLDGPVVIALHRIAREALANVARHAPHNAVELTVDVERDAVQLLVVDRGRPGAPPDPTGGHFGLIGMRERARAFGGELEAGPTVDGWRVAARLPAMGAVRDHAATT